MFSKLKGHGLRINASKCKLGRSEVNYLGYTINQEGYKPAQDRIEAISSYRRPNTIKDLRTFLGMINYYRKSIPNTAKLQVPLLSFLEDSKKKNDKRKIDWTNETEEAFERCKHSLTSITTTAFLSSSARLTLHTDASNTAIGATLEQKVDDNWRPVGFFSRKLTPTEQNYSTYDQELLAIFSGIKHFRNLLECREFSIKTNHKPLRYAFPQRSDKASPRQLWQLSYISQFSTDISYVKSEDNIVADALSRIEAINMPTLLSGKEIQTAQEADDEFKTLLE